MEGFLLPGGNERGQTAVRLNSNGMGKLGPKVKTRRKQGFGSIMIERNLARSLNAEVKLQFCPDGLHCIIFIPVSQVLHARGT